MLFQTLSLFAALLLSHHLESPARIAKFQGEIGVAAITFSNDGKLLAWTDYRTAHVFDCEIRKEVKAFLAPEFYHALSLAFSPDDKSLAVGYKNVEAEGEVFIWSMDSNEKTCTLKGHKCGVMSVAFAPEGQTLASTSGHYDDPIRLWTIHSGKQRLCLRMEECHNTHLAFSPDGRVLVSTVASVRLTKSEPGQLHMWEVATGKRRATLERRSPWVSSIGFTRDGKLLSWTEFESKLGGRGEVIVWDVLGHKEKLRLFRPGVQFLKAALDGTGGVLATGEFDGVVRLWNANDSTELIGLRDHEDQITALAFSPDGKLLASVSLDGAVRLWDTSKLLANVRARTAQQGGRP